jgi:hypothetical protein
MDFLHEPYSSLFIIPLYITFSSVTVAHRAKADSEFNGYEKLGICALVDFHLRVAPILLIYCL